MSLSGKLKFVSMVTAVLLAGGAVTAGGNWDAVRGWLAPSREAVAILVSGKAIALPRQAATNQRAR